jgi:hypothetical protein
MSGIVLDSEAVSLLARSREPDPRFLKLIGTLELAFKTGAAVQIPAAVLAEQYRGGGHDQAVDACLSRYEAIEVAPTDRTLAKRAGNLLARHGLSSAHHVDACVAALGVSADRTVILTSDPDDISRLTAGLPNVRVRAL